MSVAPPCTRHARSVWMAYCPACTAWHLAVAIALRDGKGPLASGSAAAHFRPEPPLSAVPVGSSVSLAA